MSTIEQLVDRIVKHCDPEQVILFGSHAYGNPRSDSDYDICVVQAQLDRRMRLQAELCRAVFDITPMVDIIAVSASKMKEPAFPSSVLFDIQQKGRVVYDKVRG